MPVFWAGLPRMLPTGRVMHFFPNFFAPVKSNLEHYELSSKRSKLTHLVQGNKMIRATWQEKISWDKRHYSVLGGQVFSDIDQNTFLLVERYGEDGDENSFLDSIVLGQQKTEKNAYHGKCRVLVRNFFHVCECESQRDWNRLVFKTHLDTVFRNLLLLNCFESNVGLQDFQRHL